MNITFMQRWRGNIFFVGIVLVAVWLLMRDNADYMRDHFHFWFYIAGWWLIASAGWCATSQFLFRRNIKRTLELGRQINSGKFRGDGNWY